MLAGCLVVEMVVDDGGHSFEMVSSKVKLFLFDQKEGFLEIHLGILVDHLMVLLIAILELGNVVLQ